MSEASKELHRPFTSSFGLRHMEAYSGLPAHILNHLQPQFLHPGLSLGSGDFRPLAARKAFQSPSAIARPQCLQIETNSDAVHHGHGIFSPSEERFLGPSPRTDSCSPASASMSPQPQTTVKEESLDAHMSEDGDGTHGPATDNDSPGIHDDSRGFRSKSVLLVFAARTRSDACCDNHAEKTRCDGSRTRGFSKNGVEGGSEKQAV